MFKVQMFMSFKTGAEFKSKLYADEFVTWGEAQLFASNKADEMAANVTTTNRMDVRFKDGNSATNGNGRASGVYKVVALDSVGIPAALVGELVITDSERL